MRRFVSLLIACCVAVPAYAADVTSYELDNGMEVVVLEDHRAPVVVHMVWYRAGAADEPPGVSGIAHFLEHLLFKGTDDMEANELSQTVARNGGSDNAFTNQDYTGYFQRVAADRLELMMTMEADRMRDLRLTEEDIVTERDVILEERSTRVDNNPNSMFIEQRMAALFQNSPYGIPVIGWRHEMEALGMDDALAFYETYYAPNNAILVVAGDVEPEEVLALAEKHYGPLEPTPGLGDRVRPLEPPQLAERRLVFEDPRISEPYIVRDYIAPARAAGAQEQAAALVILAEILGGNDFTSVLPRKLVFEDQKALYTWAYYSPLSLKETTFGLGIMPSPGVSLEDAETAIDVALAEFMEDGIDPDQFERVKFQLRAAHIYAEDSTEGMARRYGAALTSGLTVADIEAWPDVLAAVTVEDVMAVAASVLDKRSSVTGWARPPQPEQEVTQ
ncbi:M16 family metallopeptidase [Psychromarinibacter sp. S121]|uniref:M16 family metallopeptidase n=1 Tax=Psychromarinibacter sp. S121 TaxID=3415127 RepID=UPI003C7A1A56